jgi:hypothetical protein
MSSSISALPMTTRAIAYSLLIVGGVVIIIFVLSVFTASSPLLLSKQFAFATLADTSSSVISSFDVNPKVLGSNDVTEHGYPTVTAEAEVSYNVGVTNVAVYVYPKGTTDLVGQALQSIALVEGDAQNGKWRGIYALWPRGAPDGEYEDDGNGNYHWKIWEWKY